MDAQRGLSPEQLEYVARNKALMELIKREELFFGVRNGYFTLYFRGASLARIAFAKDGGLKIETHQKYLGRNGDGYDCMTTKQLLDRYEEIKANVEKVQASGEKGWREKNAQQALILANNCNPDSAWYCLDLEYAQARTSRDRPNDGRCDIIAVRRKPDGKGCHRVALIELKVGHSSYDGDSGIVGHLADFCHFEGSGQFQTLREEVCAILANKRALGFPVPCPALRPDDLGKTPHFYFLTLSSEIETCRKKLYHRLGVEGHGRLARDNAKQVLGSTFLDRDNYHFLFAPEDMSKRERVDLLGEADIKTL